jgi:hypothetical protein
VHCNSPCYYNISFQGGTFTDRYCFAGKENGWKYCQIDSEATFLYVMLGKGSGFFHDLKLQGMALEVSLENK